jgi:N-methylhydantoinase A
VLFSSVVAEAGSRLPAPLIVPGAVVEVHERVDASGKVVVELDIDAAAERIGRMIAEYELDSVTVALLWSFANPAHEKALAQAIPQVIPTAFVSSSSEVSPRLGEYERTVATVLNGYVGPACSRYLSDLESRLATPLLVMQSNGGVLPASAATALGTIDSGPAGGLIGVATLAGAYGHDHVVATDMGGTSFDLGLVVDGKPVVAQEHVIDQYTYRLPHLDVRSVACGGGSIAWIDEATGGLRVGPASAGSGSEPGPACYGRGWVDPTVTDADVVLGLLRPEAFLDGRMPLDRDAAVAAVGRLATRLDLTVEETAAGILRINNMHAATVIRQQTLERGHDPRDFALYAFGGAGPVHAFGYAAESGVREVVIPLGNGASTLSAYGIASGDVVLHRELERSLLAPFDGPALATAAAGLRDAALADLAAIGVTGDAQVEIDALMRYREQLMHSLEIPVSPLADGVTLLADFDKEYVRRYGDGGTSLSGASAGKSTSAQLFQAVEVFALRARVFSNAQALTIKWILENRSENPGIEPGDMFVSNDPYVGTPHQPDTIVAAPVFVGDKLFCWVANVLHHADVGGSVMGSFCVDATDIFTDPPAFPPFKLVSRGEVRRDLEEMFLRQSRVPTNVHMDLRAAVSANRVAAGRIVALVDRYGANAVKSVMNRVLDAGERTVAERLAKIPDGRWSHRLYAEAAHTGIYTYQITVRKQGEHLYVDNAGTDRQTARSTSPTRGSPVPSSPRSPRTSPARTAGCTGGCTSSRCPGRCPARTSPRRSARAGSTRWKR